MTDELIQTEKPIAKAIGQDGNVFNVLGICSSALRKVGQQDKAQEMTSRVFKAKSYDEALQIMMEYCEFK